MCSISFLQNKSVLYLEIRATKKGTCAFFDDFVSQKIVKSLIDPLKGVGPLTGVIGYLFCVVTYGMSMLYTKMMDTSPIWVVFLDSLKSRLIGMCFCKTHYMAVNNIVLVRQYMLNVQAPRDNIE